VYGPDANGVYGGLQGIGGIETLSIAADTANYGSVQDYFGNVLASISNSVVTWTSARYSSYGPVPGYQPSSLSSATTVAQTLGWHGLRIDPDGNYHVGTRRYDPVAGRFMSADPLGHGGSMDLYSYCDGDPVNVADPTGCFGKQIEEATSFNSLDIPDYVGDAHAQEVYNEIGAAIVNLATLGIADPILALCTGYGFDGKYVDKSTAAENLYLSVLMALPMLVPGAGEAILSAEAGTGLAIRGGGEALIGAGERGLVAEVEGGFVQTEFEFAADNLS